MRMELHLVEDDLEANSTQSIGDTHAAVVTAFTRFVGNLAVQPQWGQYIVQHSAVERFVDMIGNPAMVSCELRVDRAERSR